MVFQCKKYMFFKIVTSMNVLYIEKRHMPIGNLHILYQPPEGGHSGVPACEVDTGKQTAPVAKLSCLHANFVSGLILWR